MQDLRIQLANMSVEVVLDMCRLNQDDVPEEERTIISDDPHHSAYVSYLRKFLLLGNGNLIFSTSFEVRLLPSSVAMAISCYATLNRCYGTKLLG